MQFHFIDLRFMVCKCNIEAVKMAKDSGVLAIEVLYYALVL